MPNISVKGEISIVLSGEAGQGIQTVEVILTRLLKRSGFHVCATKEFMSRVRGGSNSTEIRVSSVRVDAYIDRIDLLIPLDPDISRLRGRIGPDTLVIGEAAELDKDIHVLDVSFNKTAEELGNRVFSNTIASGALLALFGIELFLLEQDVRKRFSKKSEDILNKNIEAAHRGYELGKKWIADGIINIDISRSSVPEDEILISGSEAVGLGALAGGCNFIASYPMSPGSGVLHFLAGQSNNFPIAVEQAEDEIAAINMGIGAWYAGARAMVTTSGGGFSLMCEGLSLAGMVESPMVIHIGQRPGPATGLPTRTEQGDFDLALYGGHGDFVRAIFAPGNLDEAYRLSAYAFQVADEFQVPVFILTDQYLLDSYYNIPSLSTEPVQTKQFIEKTSSDYARYHHTPGGITPRGVPGYGEGVVCADSDEHDETGHITESAEVRRKMMDKRLARLKPMTESALPPEIIGPKDFDTLIVGWGSVRNTVAETLKRLNLPKLAFAHYQQVFPLSPEGEAYLKRAKKLILVENNATGQFGALIKRMYGIEFDASVLQYDGFPFSPENLTVRIGDILGNGGKK
jgi:2-oxoglutarate ferredoxin oxidoreductase subunit alpha